MKIGRSALVAVTVATLHGCATPVLDDMIENKYFATAIHADENASYIGEWTSANTGGIYTVKINPDGTVVSCQRTHPTGSIGKVFADKKGTAIIYEGGTIERIVSASAEALETDTYGIKIAYHPNDTPPECRHTFDSKTH